MDFEAAQTGRRLYFRRAYARAGRQDHSRTPHQIQWRKRRTRSAAPARSTSCNGKVYLRKAGDALRIRQSPPTLVDHMAQTFLKKKGDISEVLRTLFRSPEFWAPDAYRAKVKTPLEFVVSAVRAYGANVTDALPLARQLPNMGMPLYGMQPPTGYPMNAGVGVN